MKEAGSSDIWFVGFDETGGPEVLSRIVSELGDTGARLNWWSQGLPKSSNAYPLPADLTRVDFAPLKLELWPEGYSRPDPLEVDAVLRNPSTGFLIGLAMMDRFRVHGQDGDRRVTLSRAITQAARVMSYWLERLRGSKPSVVVFSRVPHDYTDYLLFEACKSSGVRTIIGRSIQIGPSFLLQEGIQTKWVTGPDPTEDALTLRQELVDDVLRRVDSKAPVYMSQKEDSVWIRLWRLIAEIGREIRSNPDRETGFRKVRLARVGLRILSMLETRIVNRLSRHELKTLVKRDRVNLPNVVASGEYIYVPLHLQPEATTLPQALHLWDQRLLVEAAAISARRWNLKVIVKENPKQIQHFRGSIFWREIGSMEDVLVTDGDISTFDLIRASKAVVTLNGTAGWEARCQGVPAVAFVSAPYREAPGVFIYEDLSEIENCINEALTFPVLASDPTTELKCFLQKVQETSIPATGLVTQNSSISARDISEEEIEIVARSFTECLRHGW